MSNDDPIAKLLGLEPAPDKRTLTIAGRSYELMPRRGLICETMYRINPGYGVPNPGFSLAWTPASHHKMQLGNYLAGRPNVKRAEAEAIVEAARKLAAEA